MWFKFGGGGQHPTAIYSVYVYYTGSKKNVIKKIVIRVNDGAGEMYNKTCWNEYALRS